MSKTTDAAPGMKAVAPNYTISHCILLCHIQSGRKKSQFYLRIYLRNHWKSLILLNLSPRVLIFLTFCVMTGEVLIAAQWNMMVITTENICAKWGNELQTELVTCFSWNTIFTQKNNWKTNYNYSVLVIW